MKAHTSSMRLLAVVSLFIAFYGDFVGPKAMAQTFMPDGAKHRKRIVIPRNSVTTPTPANDRMVGPTRAEIFGVKKGQGQENRNQESKQKAEEEALNTPVVFPEDGKGEIVVNVKGQQFIASHIQNDANFTEAATALANQIVKGMVPKIKVIKGDSRSYYGINIKGGQQGEEGDTHSLIVTCTVEKGGTPSLEKLSILFTPDNSVARDKRPGFSIEYQFRGKKDGEAKKAGIATVKTITNAGATDLLKFNELDKASGLQSFWEHQFLKHLGYCHVLVESLSEEDELAKR